MATNKSKTLKPLLFHTLLYSIAMGILIEILVSNNIFGAQLPYTSAIFSAIMFITHTLIDFFTSRINAKLLGQKKTRLFFNMIGFDQLLHYATIFISIDLIFY
jgi:hypothetical protein